MDNKILYHRWAVLFGLYETARFNKSPIPIQDMHSLQNLYHEIYKMKRGVK